MKILENKIYLLTSGHQLKLQEIIPCRYRLGCPLTKDRARVSDECEEILEKRDAYEKEKRTGYCYRDLLKRCKVSFARI